MEAVSLSGFVQLLQDILGSLFDAVLAPVLREVFNMLVNIVGEMIQEVLSNFLLRIWIILLKAVYFLEQVFNVFSGISPVEITGDVSRRMPLLEYFFSMSAIGMAFWAITLAAVALVFLTTLMGVVKSMSSMAMEDRNPVSAVLRSTFTASLTFLLIPFTCLFVLQMTSKTVSVVNSTFNYGQENTALSDVVFITVAGSCAKSEQAAETYSSNQRYEDAEAVKQDFNYKKFNYVQAYVSGALIAMILMAAILQFIQRILMILVLYLVSPLFVSLMPLDGGAKFREWRNLFCAYMVSAFGPIIAMKVYLILVPMVAGNQIDFGVSDMVSAWIKLFFVIGGAFTVFSSRLLIVRVVNPSAAGAIEESGFIGGLIAGKFGGAAGSLAGGLLAGSEKKKENAPAPKASGEKQSQKYTGK